MRFWLQQSTTSCLTETGSLRPWVLRPPLLRQTHVAGNTDVAIACQLLRNQRHPALQCSGRRSPSSTSESYTPQLTGTLALAHEPFMIASVFPKSGDDPSASEVVQNEQPLVLGRDGGGPQNQPASIWMCSGQRRPGRLAASIPAIGLLEPQIGNKLHTAAKSGTTGCGLMPHRAFDSQQRCRLG